MSEPSPPPEALAAASDARTARHLRNLAELAEIGMELSREVREQARATEDPAARADLGLAFSRISRAVRMTMALETRLAEDRETARTARAKALAGETQLRGWTRKTKVGRIVEQAIEAEAAETNADRRETEGLLDDLAERLGDTDELEFADRPIGDLVARICRDLGVTADWSLWEDEDWAIAQVDAKVAGATPRASPDVAPSQAPAADHLGAGDPEIPRHEPP
jgi:hypothetical protein